MTWCKVPRLIFKIVVLEIILQKTVSTCLKITVSKSKVFRFQNTRIRNCWPLPIYDLFFGLEAFFFYANCLFIGQQHQSVPQASSLRLKQITIFG